MLSMTLPDYIGFAGVALLLLAFALNLLGVIDRNGILYAILNIVGAGVAAYASWLINYVPFIVLEGVWCAVSVFALGKILISPTQPDA